MLTNALLGPTPVPALTVQNPQYSPGLLTFLQLQEAIAKSPSAALLISRTTSASGAVSGIAVAEASAPISEKMVKKLARMLND